MLPYHALGLIAASIAPLGETGYGQAAPLFMASLPLAHPVGPVPAGQPVR